MIADLDKGHRWTIISEVHPGGRMTSGNSMLCYVTKYSGTTVTLREEYNDEYSLDFDDRDENSFHSRRVPKVRSLVTAIHNTKCGRKTLEDVFLDIFHTTETGYGETGERDC